MTKHPLWSEDYWILLLQLYLRKPVGVKPLYSKPLVDLSLELHIPPQFLHSQLFQLRSAATPHLKRLLDLYANNPSKLQRDIRRLKQMSDFCSGGTFFEGVAVNAPFEKDFLPLPSYPALKPVMLLMILNLYYQLTPITMVKETPEVAELAKRMKIKPELVVEVLLAYQNIDPYLRNKPEVDDALLQPCKDMWRRYGYDSPEQLETIAAQMKDYFQ